MKMNFSKCCLWIILSLFFAIGETFAEQPKMSFWMPQKRGANIFNKKVTLDLIRQAKAYDIGFFRLVPDKFSTKSRDFLMGNADHYEKLDSADLKALREILDLCAQEKMPVVLAFLSLPGSRWKQNNHFQDDLRLWSDDKYFEQAVRFWQDVVKELHDHPAIVGYNILNEPHPERLWDKKSSDISHINQEDAQKKLFSFYSTIVKAIREIDPTTPIIVESSGYADVQCFENFIPLEDDYVLYSFHMYDPQSYTNHKNNNGKYSYPGLIPDPDTQEFSHWDAKALDAFFKPVLAFQKKHQIPGHRILVGEFGGDRCSKGLSTYFEDLINIFSKNNWHWAIYSFREDVWDVMDYELGDQKLPWQYWKDLEAGKTPAKPYKSDNPIFMILRKGWSQKISS